MKIGSSPVYLDASALAKLYATEPGSAVVEGALAGRRDLIISDLTVTAVVSAAVRRVREKELEREDAGEIHKTLIGEVERGQLGWVELNSSVHRDAEKLLMDVGCRVALRAADALHLALAMAAGAQALVTFDRRMREAARALGGLELPA